MAKEIDAFVLANLIEAQLQHEWLSDKLQWRLLKPGEKFSAGQQHPGRALFCAALYRREDLTELLIREPIGFIEDEERGIRLGRVRYCVLSRSLRPTSPRQRRRGKPPRL